MQTLKQTLQQQLILMLARNLDYSPSADEIHMTVEVYYQDLVNIGLTDEDAGRLKQAMDRLGPMSIRFPRLADIMPMLPRKAEPKLLDLDRTPEQTQAGLSKLAKIQKKLAGKMRI